MKQFTIDTPIQPERHFHIPFQEAINESWELLQAGNPYTILFPPASGKSSLIQNLHHFVMNNSNDTAIFLDFKSFSRTDFSTTEKFNASLKSLLLNQARNISDHLYNFVYKAKLETIEDLFEFFADLTKIEGKKYYLLIDDADKHCRQDSFSSFLGLILHSMEISKSRVITSFTNIVISASKKINGFKPFERILTSSEYFKTWDSTTIQKDYIEANEETIGQYLQDYATAIEFELDSKTIEQLIDETSGKLISINKMLRFYDEKVRIYKQKKIITPEEMQHAAGYALISAPY
ncbi:MAG: hypothetical protein COA79_03420 [Planctomycetota bacterium]|nr:MAG: hypothetical protein COA79_03420 [Planctomycetota bacterium]